MIATSALALLRDLRENEEGASIIEFAMVIGPFMLICIAILDFGYRSYVDVIADSVSYRVAREATAGTITPKEVEDEAVRLLSPLLLTDASIVVTTRSYFDFTSVGRPETISVDGNSNNDVDEGDCWIDENGNANFDMEIGEDGLGGADDVVIYSIDVESSNLTGISSLLGLSGNRFNVNATASGRNQPFDLQTEQVVIEYCMAGGVAVEVI